MAGILMVAAAAAVVAFTPVDALRTAAETAVLQARPGSTVAAHIDANVRLAACGMPLQADVQGDGQTPSVRLSCAGPHPWTLYVPVRVTQQQSVLVLTRPVGAGQPITADMVALQTRDIASLSQSYFTDPSVAVGALAVRTLAAGTVLSLRDVRAAPVVHKGQPVTLQFRSGALSVTAPGLALGDAASGQEVRAENSSSHRIVIGTVDAQGHVVVGAS